MSILCVCVKTHFDAYKGIEETNIWKERVVYILIALDEDFFFHICRHLSQVLYILVISCLNFFLNSLK